MTERTEGLIVLAVGVAVIALAQLGTPHRAPPLYDGVVVEEPYRYLSPPPGAPGSPKSYTATEPVQGGQSAELVAATPESRPQAQLGHDALEEAGEGLPGTQGQGRAPVRVHQPLDARGQAHRRPVRT